MIEPPLPGEYVWVTAPFEYKGGIYTQLVLIKAEAIFIDPEFNEWVVRCGEWCYFLSDCMMPEEQLIVENRLDEPTK